MKNQIYLEPQQVKILIELGIDFEETYMVTIVHDESAHYNTAINRSMAERFYHNEMYWGKDWRSNFVPAPSLQEVLEKLPNELNHPDTHYWLELSQNRITKNEWRICYVCYESSYFVGDNPLLVAFELLKWVTTKCPKSLIQNK